MHPYMNFLTNLFVKAVTRPTNNLKIIETNKTMIFMALCKKYILVEDKGSTTDTCIKKRKQMEGINSPLES